MLTLTSMGFVVVFRRNCIVHIKILYSKLRLSYRIFNSNGMFTSQYIYIYMIAGLIFEPPCPTVQLRFTIGDDHTTVLRTTPSFTACSTFLLACGEVFSLYSVQHSKLSNLHTKIRTAA